MKKRIFVMTALATVLALLTACAPAVPSNAENPVDNPPAVADNPPVDADSESDTASDAAKAPEDATSTDVPGDDFLETKPEGVTGEGDDIPPEYAGRTVITIAAKTESVFGYWDGSLGKVLKAFHAAQDEIYIQTKSYQEYGTQNQIPEERIYAQMINGDRADLYFTSQYQFGIEQLVNAGLIQDWYPVLEADPAFEVSDYLTSVWGTFEDGDGRLFELCSGYMLRYALRVPASQAEGLDTYDGFLTYLEENDVTVSQEAALLEGDYYLDWIDMETLTCDFQSESFIEWLDFLSALAPERDRDKERGNSGRISNLIRFKQDGEEAGCWLRYIEIPGRYSHMPRVDPWDSFALSSTTEHVDACMKFIRWLLSYDTQQLLYGRIEGKSYTGYYALPVNRAVWERNLERIQLSGEDEAALDGGTMRGSVPMYPDLKRGDFIPGLPAEEAEYIRQIVENVDRGQGGSMDAGKIFWDELEVFRQGDITAEECAERLQKRFTIYLAERQ